MLDAGKVTGFDGSWMDVPAGRGADRRADQKSELKVKQFQRDKLVFLQEPRKTVPSVGAPKIHTCCGWTSGCLKLWFIRAELYVVSV